MLIKNDLNSMNTINTINNYKNNENKSMVNSRTNGLSSNVSDRVEISKEAKVLMKEKESEISANTKRIEELRLKIEEGTIVNPEYVPEVPTEEDGTLDKEVVRKNEMYWQYLNTPLSSVDFTELLKQNKDTVGWLIVNNTNINYPVVQTTNNDYYLKHAFDRSKNYAGWVSSEYLKKV